ncbi:MAG: hypothetical protein KC535_01925 [Nanoarchaeota archaeon]|nr:hypothetical protein [Nanoarchaeota archaeon]
MNKRGQDWLNVMELFVVVFCLFFAFFFLAQAKEHADQKASDQLVTISQEYQNTQLLRTFLETELEVNGERMTVAQAANNYFEIKDYLESNTLEGSQEQSLVLLSQDYEHAIASLADQLQLDDYILVPLNTEVTLSFHYRLQGKTIEGWSIPVDRFYDDNKDFIFEPISVEVPAYFAHSYQRLGSYSITLDLAGFYT